MEVDMSFVKDMTKHAQAQNSNRHKLLVFW